MLRYANEEFRQIEWPTTLMLHHDVTPVLLTPEDLVVRGQVEVRTGSVV